VVQVATVTEKIPYYRVKNGVGYWEPPAWARLKPYEMEGLTCGPDGPEARELARGRVQLMRRLKVTGDVSLVAPAWPPGSLGHFYEKWTRTPGFGKKALGTRDEFEQAWAHVPDKLKRTKLTAIRPTEIERLQIDLEAKGEWTRWRTIKKLREVFAGAKAHGFIQQSPAMTMSNPEPEGRSQLWTAAEVEALIDKADELGKPDMALSIALAWATMVSPVDVRTLTRAMVFEDRGGLYIQRTRSKTGVGIMTDLDDKTCRRLRAYMNGTPATLPSAPIIRQENSGKAFKDRHDFARRFATIRKAAFGKDEKRQLRDIRRSANVEADLGGASADDRAKILGNALNTDPKLERTYTPATLAKARELRKQRETGRVILAASFPKLAKSP
jgi:integrase